MLKCLITWYVLITGLIICGNCFAQSPTRAYLNSVITTVNSTTEKLAIEKLYLQTDKQSYQAGDTLWFKGYLLNEASLSSSTKSGLLYVELASDSNRLVKRVMLPVYMGLTYGSIVLQPEDVPQGGYTLRAYTNWMRNFGEDAAFQKHFYVSGAATADSWLVNYNAATTSLNGKDNVRLKLLVNQLDKDPVRVREMQLRLSDGKRTLLRSEVQTDLAGEMDVNFNLLDKVNAQNLSLSLKDMRKNVGNRVLEMPLMLNRKQNIDLQFMPEGGNLVAGIPAHVAFKAVTENGLSTNVSGKVFNKKMEEVASFASTHKGMGVFDFTPAANEVYTARVQTDGVLFKSFSLPAVAAKGLSLRVNNPYKADSCEVVINGSADSLIIGRTYYLIAQARGMVCYGASFKLLADPTKLYIAKNLLPTGITRFMLLDVRKTVLSERMIYIDHADQLKIRLSASKPAYGRRDSVALQMEVRDKEGNPVIGSFSLAVTDDNQVKIDTLAANRINSYLYLASNLNGVIEDSGYYTNPAADALKWQHTDQLLMVHGWVGYKWDNYFKPAAPMAFNAEQQFSIRGKVTNAFNKPVSNSGITLFSKKPFLITDTTSNDKGIFMFNGIYPSDTAVYFLQAKNKRGKSFNVGIEMEEFMPPVFKDPVGRLVPWYVNIDTAQLRLKNKQKQLKEEQNRVTQGNVLKAVEVKAKKVIKGSKNLNGAGGSDVVIDEEELKRSGRTALRQLLEKRVKGFYLKTLRNFNKEYVINSNLLHLIIDGVEIDFFFNPDGGLSRYQYYDQYLDYYDAEEIKGIEVMSSSKYSLNYFSAFIASKNPLAIPFEHCFIEVTTRSGSGPFMKKAVGTYVYRPMPFALPKVFYAPKYKAGAVADMTDIRSTVHWEPNIVTGKDGKAKITFYTADNVGSYTINIEGADLQGNVGVQTSSIKINK
ncbi:hypothetical protein [Mucilaginibacter aquatilis]|uniref:Carboxypeptidase regulatory-like domain-containing protein n=1 Tax=Mucilaginibacter aquatilis TaxID=1517760 RepID=A0A6I4I7J6_9SPHI|nr:hypothetical protein [Mucilaginibacter aquatilis]MVN90857.1 hypothetical protein [Mucilaginibacter aquatilis]